MSVPQRSLLLVLLVATVVSCLAPLYPREMFLQHIPTVVFLVALPLTARRFPLSDAAVTCLVAFMLLHVLGARYVYSNVPYDEWMQATLGGNLSAAFGFERNHYDRLVHFCFGALWVLPVREVGVRYVRLPPRFAWYAAIEFVLAFSALYEVFEWGLTMVLSPESADSYNGQQGDLWDAQKDMFLAMAGALIALPIVARRPWKGVET